mgnify:FL=1|jgi:hypothetical protein
MPGWRDPTGGLGDDPSGGAGAVVLGELEGGKKRKATSVGGSKPKAAKKATATSKGGKPAVSKYASGNPQDNSDDDDMPLSGLVKQHTGGHGGQSAAALAEAAALRLGIPLPSQTVSTAVTGDGDDDDDDGAEGGGKGGAAKSRSRSWLPSEDELVRSLVTQHGPRKWTLIATRLKTKTQKQVYARWRDYLQPGLTTKPWTPEEQQRLVELQAHVGNQWAVLARLMPGRSPNAIKNRYHATKRKMERHNKRDGGPGEGSDATGAGTASAGGGAGAGLGGVSSKKTKETTVGGPPTWRTMGAPSLAMSDEEYSKEEQMAVEGLLLADTPTSLMGLREAKEADAHFDAALSIQDRLGEEAAKAAKAAKAKKR